MKNYDLLIVGNGFDIGSGYDTTYRTFLEDNDYPMQKNFLFQYCYFSHSNHYQTNNDWNGYEKLLCQFLQFVNYLFISENVKRYFSDKVDDGFYESWMSFCFEIIDINKVPEDMFRTMYLSSYFRSLFGSLFINKESIKVVQSPIVFKYRGPFPINIVLEKDVVGKIIDSINKELINLENLLKEHIRKKTLERKSLPFLLLDCHVSRVLSFNYSHSAQDAFNLKEEDVAYVHGDVNHSVVLGVEPSMIDNQSFDEDSDFITFFKRFRRILKNCNVDYNGKIINKLTSESVIGIYGHSLDLSDRSILKPLFEKEYKRYDIYCYGDVDNYKIKLAKLISINLYEKLRNANKINIIDIKAAEKH